MPFQDKQRTFEPMNKIMAIEAGQKTGKISHLE